MQAAPDSGDHNGPKESDRVKGWLKRRRVAAHRLRPARNPRPTRRWATYAEALGRLLPVTAPMLEALREAGAEDEECRSVRTAIEERRAANMRLFAADLRTTGELRDDLGDDEVADLVWSMNSASYYTALTRRGWSSDQYADLVRDVWTRTLLTWHRGAPVSAG